MNSELTMTLMQAFITDHERALEDLFGDIENSRKFDNCLNTMATRIATVFASLKVCHLRNDVSKLSTCDLFCAFIELELCIRLERLSVLH